MSSNRSNRTSIYSADLSDSSYPSSPSQSPHYSSVHPHWAPNCLPRYSQSPVPSQNRSQFDTASAISSDGSITDQSQITHQQNSHLSSSPNLLDEFIQSQSSNRQSAQQSSAISDHNSYEITEDGSSEYGDYISENIQDCMFNQSIDEQSHQALSRNSSEMGSDPSILGRFQMKQPTQWSKEEFLCTSGIITDETSGEEGVSEFSNKGRVSRETTGGRSFEWRKNSEAINIDSSIIHRSNIDSLPDDDNVNRLSDCGLIDLAFAFGALKRMCPKYRNTINLDKEVESVRSHWADRKNYQKTTSNSDVVCESEAHSSDHEDDGGVTLDVMYDVIELASSDIQDQEVGHSVYFDLVVKDPSIAAYNDDNIESYNTSSHDGISGPSPLCEVSECSLCADTHDDCQLSSLIPTNNRDDLIMEPDIAISKYETENRSKNGTRDACTSTSDIEQRQRESQNKFDKNEKNSRKIDLEHYKNWKNNEKGHPSDLGRKGTDQSEGPVRIGLQKCNLVGLQSTLAATQVVVSEKPALYDHEIQNGTHHRTIGSGSNIDAISQWNFLNQCDWTSSKPLPLQKTRFRSSSIEPSGILKVCSRLTMPELSQIQPVNGNTAQISDQSQNFGLQKFQTISNDRHITQSHPISSLQVRRIGHANDPVVRQGYSSASSPAQTPAPFCIPVCIPTRQTDSVSRNQQSLLMPSLLAYREGQSKLSHPTQRLQPAHCLHHPPIDRRLDPPTTVVNMMNSHLPEVDSTQTIYNIIPFRSAHHKFRRSPNCHRRMENSRQLSEEKRSKKYNNTSTELRSFRQLPIRKQCTCYIPRDCEEFYEEKIEPKRRYHDKRRDYLVTDSLNANGHYRCINNMSCRQYLNQISPVLCTCLFP